MNSRMQRFLLLTVILIFSLATASTVFGQTSKPSDDKETLRELLDEVRMLRQALQTLQRMSVDTYRTQTLVEQIRINREDVRRLTASLNQTRDDLMKTQNTIPQFIDRQKLLEGQVQSEIDPQKRAQLEFELRRTKEATEMYKSQIEPYKEREQQLAAELNTEKAKLDDLEGRLQLLERAIENDRQKLDTDKPAPARTP